MPAAGGELSPCSLLAFGRPAGCVSSGRQMPTSEHRGHFGLSSSGGGMSTEAAIARIFSSNSRVRSTNVSSNGIDTRRRDSM